jgi:hypothetical protein
MCHKERIKMKICYDNLEKLHLTSNGTFRTKDHRLLYLYTASCKECNEPFLAVYKKQLFCDNECRGKYQTKQTLLDKKCKCGEINLSEFYNITARIRKEAIDMYGGKCECCGETIYEFLALDHIHGGGSNHKKKLKEEGTSIWYWLKKHRYPKGEFRVLCHNCNQSLGAWGYCPHNRGGKNDRSN